MAENAQLVMAPPLLM